MQVFQARLDSFLKTKRIKGTVINWPHPDHFLATPSSLAEAGFYYCPTWDERDAVKCYMCGKELSDWLEDDDPFAIHWRKCPTSCPWAILRCGLQNDLDRDGKCVSTRFDLHMRFNSGPSFVSPDPTRVPSSDHLRKARLKTFTSWPHDSDPSHGATSEQVR